MIISFINDSNDNYKCNYYDHLELNLSKVNLREKF